MRPFLPFLAAAMLFSGAACATRPQYRTDATIKDIMDSIVDPNADYVWGSVATTYGVTVEQKAPKTDEDWKEVRRHALALMEATNLLQMPGRGVARPGERADDPRIEEQPEAIQSMIDADRESWTKLAHGLYDATSVILKAVDAKDANAILMAGDGIDRACEACHLKYWYPRQHTLFEKDRPSTSERGSK